MTTLRVFKAQLRALRAFEMRDLVDAGIIDKDDVTEFRRYARDPVNWLLTTNDVRAAKMWVLVQKRMG